MSKLRDELEAAFDESFMKPAILHGTWWKVDGTMGIWYYPGLGTYGCGMTSVEATEAYGDGADEPETIKGYGARLSAPGYMDCTDWLVCATEDEAIHELLELYGE